MNRVTVELPAMPATGSLYRGAVAGLVRRRTATGLPLTALVVRGVHVDLERLAGYDRVCGFRLTDALPATYPHVLAFPMAMRLMNESAFPFPVVGLVHVANRITVVRPVTVADVVDFTVYAADLRPHDRGRQFDVIATATVNDAEVWRGVSTYLRREKPATRPTASEPIRYEPIRPEPTASGADAAGSGGAGPPDPGSAAEPSAQWAVGTDVGREYADVSGDRNPIHTSRLGARAFGFPRPIAHGMWSNARVLAALEGRLPDAFTVAVAFRRPILLPSTVLVHATTTVDGFTVGLSDRAGRPYLTGTVTRS